MFFLNHYTYIYKYINDESRKHKTDNGEDTERCIFKFQKSFLHFGCYTSKAS